MSEFEEMSYAETLVALHQLVETEEHLSDSLQRCAEIAHAVVPSVEGVGLTLRDDESASTVAFSGDAAQKLDSAQYEDDEGPCLEAFRENRLLNVRKIADELSRWPTFVRCADEVGVRSSLSVPLRLDDNAVGALNLYANSDDAFDPAAVDIAEKFGVQASIAVTNAKVYWQAKHLAEHLTRALDNRDVIGQAKGILMREHRIGGDEAFEMIRRESQHRNVKVSALAEEITLRGELPARP